MTVELEGTGIPPMRAATAQAVSDDVNEVLAWNIGVSLAQSQLPLARVLTSPMWALRQMLTPPAWVALSHLGHDHWARLVRRGFDDYRRYQSGIS
jgi:hypothetical protein